MTGAQQRIRIVLGDRELELEGDVEFIAQYDDTVEVLLQVLLAGSPTGRVEGASPSRPAVQGFGVVDKTFGEQLGELPKSATATDRMLLAGRFAQLLSEDNSFSTKESNSLLLEQSVKVGNPSQCMTNNLKAKRVFKIGDRYRVSRPGEEYLALLGAPAL